MVFLWSGGIRLKLNFIPGPGPRMYPGAYPYAPYICGPYAYIALHWGHITGPQYWACAGIPAVSPSTKNKNNRAFIIPPLRTWARRLKIQRTIVLYHDI